MLSVPFLTRNGQPAAGRGGAAAGRAPKLEALFADETGNKGLAFCLQWKTIASSGGRDDAIALARSSGATHYVYRGQQVGFAAMPADISPTARLFPAAMVAARAHPGWAVTALRIGEGEYWLAVTSNGSPTSTDRFLHDSDDSTALQAVRELLARQEQASAGVQVSVYTNIEDHGLESAKHYDVPDMLELGMSESELLVEVPKASLAIPKPVQYAALALLAFVVAQQGYKHYQDKKRAEAIAANAAGDLSPEQAWAQTLATWQAGVAALDGTGLLTPRASLNGVPIEWDGWLLTTAACKAGAPGGGTRTWSCQAAYQRGPAGDVNTQMVRNVPAGWTVQFKSLGGMQVSWSLAQQVAPIKVEQLQDPKHFEIEVASKLQRLLPALTGDVSLSFTPVVLTPPKRRDGSAIPPIPRAQGLVQSSIAVKAPLRSLDALIGADVDADWKELSVSFDSTGLKGVVNGSALMAEAHGDVYAQKKQ